MYGVEAFKTLTNCQRIGALEQRGQEDTQDQFILHFSGMMMSQRLTFSLRGWLNAEKMLLGQWEGSSKLAKGSNALKRRLSSTSTSAPWSLAFEPI
jgi:hypothetical protein